MRTTGCKAELAAALLGLAWAAPAMAEENCPQGMICASDPSSIVRGLQELGYPVRLLRSKTSGNPLIESSANGYNFAVFFYGCSKGRDCTSLDFVANFEKDGANSAELANAWNVDNRFSQMAYNDDGTLSLGYDLSTVGGISSANFASVVDWWQSTLKAAKLFFAGQKAKR